MQHNNVITSESSFCSNLASANFSLADFDGLFDNAWAMLKAPGIKDNNNYYNAIIVSYQKMYDTQLWYTGDAISTVVIQHNVYLPYLPLTSVSVDSRL